MSFTVYARRVRDHTLPHAHRRSALRSAIVLFKPFGFQATWSYLGTAGDLDRDGDALLRALEKLESSRDAGIAERAAFAERRREEKRILHRQRPSAADAAFFRGPRWPGPDGHGAAVHEVARLWRAHAGPFPELPAEAAGAAMALGLDLVVCGHVSSYLAAGGRLDRHRLDLVADCLPGLRRWTSLLYPHDAAHTYVRRLLRMAELILSEPGGGARPR
ncbi:hypothetical protein AB0I68_06040 [Streptomyces sp. NPDC050448]|uniref:hypothetical protein n=1 Tax=Streptomyces sp. NPDC050448 TaxID=3155404 RepID=UPI003414134B